MPAAAPRGLTTGAAARRLGTARDAACFLRDAFAGTSQFTAAREVRGVPLASLQVVRHALADLWAELAIYDAAIAATGHALAAGHPAAARGVAGVALALAAAAKPFVARCAQLVGARGYMLDHPVGRAQRDVARVAATLGRRTELAEDCDALGNAVRGTSDAWASLEVAPALRTAARAFARDLAVPWFDNGDDARDVTLRRSAFESFGREGFLRTAPDVATAPALGDLLVVAEELAAARALGPAVSLLVAANTIRPLLREHATDRVRAEWLSAVERGACVAALAVTEAASGSALPHGVTTGASRDGDGWRIDGEKAYVTNATISDLLVVLAATAPGAGPLGVSLFAVPTRAAGVLLTGCHEKLGLRESPTGVVRFDGVRVPDDALIGRLHLGFAPFARAMAGERLLIAAGAAALARSCVDALLAPAAGRVADCAWRRTELYELRATAEACAAFVHRAAAEATDGAPRPELAYAAKSTAIDLCQQVVARCADLAERDTGDDGELADGESWARAAADARALSVFAGPSEAMREALAVAVLPNG